MTEINNINVKIKERYTMESSHEDSLSCGNTLLDLKPLPGEWILDLGCGRGTDTIEVAKKVGKDGKAVGLDLTESMVAMATERALAKKVDNIEFVHGDIEDLPFPMNTFDGVISNCVINHAKDKGKVYREIQRILKPGGRFVVSDPVTRDPLPNEVKEDPDAWAQCFGGAITEEEYLHSIHSAGFGTVDIINRREYLKNGYDFISLTIKAVK